MSDLCGKQDTGSPLSRKMIGVPRCQTPLPMCRDNSNKEIAGIDIGNSWSPSPRRNLYSRFAKCSPTQGTTNHVDQEQPGIMCGKSKPGLESSSSLESSQSTEASQSTGSESGSSQSSVQLNQYQLIYEFDIITHCAKLNRIIYNRILWLDNARYIMVGLESENLEEHGMRPVQPLTLRIHAQNFGAATEVSQMLSSMNFEAELTSLTCSDGLIVTQYEWKLREAAESLLARRSGLPPISTPETGTPIWTQLPWTPLSED